MFIVFRLLMGLVACTAVTLGGGFIADLMASESRARALSIYTMGPLLGPVLGPVIGGYLAEGAGWHWVFWPVAILSGILMIVCLASIPETYSPVLLMRNAARLRKETGDLNLRSRFDDAKSPFQTFTSAILRPTKMLLFAPVVSIMAIYIALIYSYMHLLFTTFTFIFIDQYGFNAGEAGLAYLGVGVGFILGLFATGFYSDKVVKRKRLTAPPKPEDHLIPLIFGAISIPIGLFIYGWTAYYKTHWIVPIIGTGFFGLGMLCAFMPIQLYLVETYTIYAASAIASNTVLRSLRKAVLPLAGQKMYQTLGLGWGNSLLGFLSVVLIPVPLLLVRYGERIRSSPRFQIEL